MTSARGFEGGLTLRVPIHIPASDSSSCPNVTSASFSFAFGFRRLAIRTIGNRFLYYKTTKQLRLTSSKESRIKYRIVVTFLLCPIR
jgi:hypothetical protein